MNLKFLFADVSHPADHAAKELGTDAIGLPVHLRSPKKFWQVIIEQLINSVIVGGIAGMAALGAADWSLTWKVALYAFGMTFLVEMRKYRLGK